jgi:hypothetical protein
MIVPFYQDWTFWAVIIATLAIILSQLPPIHLLFKDSRLEVEPYSRVSIYHKIGNPNASLHLLITNVGGRDVRIKRIILKLKRDGKDIAQLPAQNYYQNPGDKTTVLFTGFLLKPNEDWAHTATFLNYFSRTDEKKYRNAESNLRNDILMKRALPENKEKIVDADCQLVSPFLEMFNQNFIWQPGDYEMTISIDAAKKVNFFENRYRFTLYESDSNELAKVKDAYKTGDGINWDSGNYAGVLPQLTEI